jgi:hypothetical protein
MTLDLGLDLLSNGGNGITLKFTDAAGSQDLVRAMPALDPKQLDQLRRGDSKKKVVDALTVGVSDWMLGQELAALISAALSGNDRRRLVVRMDPELAATLSDLPVELVWLPKAIQPLVLHPNLGALVHVPPLGPTVAPAAARTWPLRILFVRSNPADLGGAVPEATPIVAEIRKAASGLPEGAVQVEVLSGETQAGDPVTWKAFRDALASPQAFDVLVYLGHGDLQKGPTDSAPVGYLQFESSDGNGHEAIDARRIAAELFQHPVRVVLLAGCLTAAQVPKEQKKLVTGALAQWQRGAQGVAQAIVDSEAPVELAVGMRDRLETGDASLFLASFFKSLIKTAPGDVERAIRAARDELWGAAPIPPAWSSAVVFTKGTSPMFPFLAEPPLAGAFSAEKQAKLDGIRASRAQTIQLFFKAADRKPVLDLLALIGDGEKGVIGSDAMVKPKIAQGAAGSIAVDVELAGSVKGRRLDGKVEIVGEGVTIAAVTPDPRLDAAGYHLLAGNDGPTKSRFVIESDPVAPVPTLAAGRLFTIQATFPGPAPAIYNIFVTRASTDGTAVVWSGADVVAVVE